MNMEFISIVLLVALISAFVILLAGKLKYKNLILTEYVQVHGNELFAKMFSCQFCLSFWVAAIISITMFLLLWDYRLLFIPFLSTPLTRRLL